MLFNSYIFILLFLPVSVAGYFLINKTGRYTFANAFLVAMSLWFYGYYNPSYLLVICISIVGNYIFSKAILQSDVAWSKKALLAVGIIVNLASIFYFKYFNFFIKNVNRFFPVSFEMKNIVLPLGISFFTFQQISYLVDSYRGQTKDYGFIEYALFVSFFPQLIAGPIVLHKETVPQFRNTDHRRFSAENLSYGLYVFSIGLFKKVMIADTFGKAVSWGFGNVEAMTSMDAIVVSLCYTFQLYFDFSGYCDMAVGIGHMFNIQFPQNFNSPYKATSIVDFWTRWHMTLTRFLREYLYYPLGGSRNGKARTYVNIMIVFLVSGIWHGANWTFIIWGLLHGILNCLTRMGNKLWEKLHPAFQWAATFFMVDILWVIFRADGVSQAKAVLKRMLELSDLSLTEEITKCFVLPEFAYIQRYPFVKWMTHIHNVWFWLYFIGAFFIVLNLRNVFEIRFKHSIAQGLMTIVFMVWSIMSLAGVSEFLYFGF